VKEKRKGGGGEKIKGGGEGRKGKGG